MLRRFSVLLLLVSFNLLLTGCLSLSEKFYTYKQNLLLQKQAAQDEQQKNERKKILGYYLKADPEQASIPAIKSLAGEYKGSTCNGKIDVAVNISYEYTLPLGDASPSFLIVHGKMRMVDPNGRNIETYIKGKVQPGGKYLGLLNIESINQPTFREFLGLVTGTNDRINQLILDDTAKDSSLLDAYEKMFESRKLEDRGPFGQPNFVMRMQLASDADGNGWVGSFVADGFEDCHELTMKNKANKSTAMFLPLDAGVAFSLIAKMSGLQFYSGTEALRNRTYLKNKIYWYKVAEKLGFDKEAEKRGSDNVKISNALAETYMKMAQAYPQSSAQYYQQARKYYLKNAQAVSDARAQLALVQIYREGLGTPINNKEADKWQALATRMYTEAAKICSAHKMIDAMYVMLKRDDRRAAAIGGLLTLTTNVAVDPGSSRIDLIWAADVATMDRPFVCMALTKSVGAGADASGVPDFVIAGTDRFGTTYVYDRSLEKATLTVAADFIDNLLKNRKIRNGFNIYPHEGKKFTVSSDFGIGDQLEIDLR